VVANQQINPETLSKIDSYYGKPGANTLHEITEAYQGAKLSQQSGISSPDANSKQSVYNLAHATATLQAGPVNERRYDKVGEQLIFLFSLTKSADWFVQQGNRPPLIIQTWP
jgi:hypothetical protein